VREIQAEGCLWQPVEPHAQFVRVRAMGFRLSMFSMQTSLPNDRHRHRREWSRDDHDWPATLGNCLQLFHRVPLVLGIPFDGA